MLINCIKRLLSLGYSEIMSIRARMNILSLYIIPHYCITKTSDFTSIVCHNVLLESCRMVGMTSMRAPSWHDDICVCALTVFVPYSIRKFILMFSFYYFWIWHISGLASYHVLSTDHIHIRLVPFCLFFLCIHDVSYPFSSYIHEWFDFSSLCLHNVFDFFFVRDNLNHISDIIIAWLWSHM